MKIYHKEDALRISKPEGISVDYYLFNEYEIHYNKQAPNSSQTWHHHEKVWETLYIIDGELIAKWKDGEIEKSEIVKSGDLLETERTPHVFINNSNQTVKFIVFKQLLSGKNKKDILKKDKVLD